MLQELSVDDLKQNLQEKEKMVATLTEYLEQAAVKLNELQKTSGANAPRAFDSEMVHRQMELVSHLQEAVTEWEELKAPETLERISSQLENLRATIVDGLAAQAQPGTPNEFSPGSFESGTFGPPPESPAAEPQESEGNGIEDWEVLKAEMLKEEDGPAEAEQEPGHIDLKEELDVLVNRPTAVDADCHDGAVWQAAVNSREKYIISLIRALRVVESRRRGAPDWESFALAPANLRQDVAHLAADLQQTLRNGEVELSIERARISRQESLIAQQRREIDKAMKKHGIATPAQAASDSQQGRWLKFLNKNEGE